ncbi:rhamnan synthesis F family protein [Methylobacterium sp. 88A]|uniref:rhamnan synthesis F family protein n=1 Tax=Methylobacterium sp. 88A TaxID=1131813 RepID=UPI0009D92335|nr:rhamnan synthesis F family protein [Methylobacterium sp. 88A]
MHAVTPPIPRSAPVVVLAHVHYPDIWNEFAERLAERMDVPFRLVVTTSTQAAELRRPATSFLQAMDVLPVENRGRDILPFLRALADIGDFDIGLKLHTKKSPQRTDGSAWRAQLYDTLLPPEGGVSNLVARMRADRRIGLVAPDGFSLSVRPWVFVNAEPMATVMSILGHELVDADLDDAFFAAGSMFWFRKPALAALADPALPSVFEAEEGQLDGTIAHAIERLFAVETRRRGLITTTIGALAASRPDQSSEDLFALARAHADVPNVYFPAPGVSSGGPPASPQSRPRTRLRRLLSMIRTGIRR